MAINNIQVNVIEVEYPKIELIDGDRLSEAQIDAMIKDHKTFMDNYGVKKQYYMGNNINIMKKKVIDPNAPDNKIAVPYSRTMTQIVKGYMGKPGLVKYSSDDEAYMEVIKDIFDKNKETIVTSEDIENQSKYGVSFEIVWSDEDKEGETIPMFRTVKPQEIIPIFSQDLKQSLQAFIRYYVKETLENSVTIFDVFVYYKDIIQKYEMTETTTGERTFKIIEESDHFFLDVPLCIFINNQEYLADFEAVKTLIDAYDLMSSDAMDELDRFAAAYLILQNMMLANDRDANQTGLTLQKLKEMRVFNVNEDGDVKFLTKEIPSGFFDSVRQALRDDIQYHSHIPDFRGKSFEAKSGEAQKWALFDFNNLCGDKETGMSIGLQRRLSLIENFLSIGGTTTEEKINIDFDRNLPQNELEEINKAVLLKQAQLLSDEDILRLLPESIVQDIESALEKLKGQKEENMAMFDIESRSTEDDEEDQGEE